ncbi:MAG: cupredoxin domain-containing protein [Candidatus Dormibacteraeota bacterium]|uniref:Cupredoxin domain-containing protein n=1 Tax=Candidatus Amunia macphersoniae TaxID=3127014 RepID=A0A934NGL0_9BACT|nr:cupredoxin domain-containing protein [Candidatus Dormibacteraeota bacterium]
MTRIRPIAIGAGLALVILLSGCGNGPPAGAVAGGGGGGTVGSGAASGLGTPAKQVQATADLKFNPGTTTVKSGDVIQWTNTGGVPHNVTFDSYQTLTSQTMQQGDLWQVKFTTAGTYAYHCTFHPGMDGQITVGG